MEEVTELFEKYAPIMCIYENDTEYICIPQVEKGGEPLTVFYDKRLNRYNELYWYQYSPIEDIQMSKLIYGKPLNIAD